MGHECILMLYDVREGEHANLVQQGKSCLVISCTMQL